MAASLLAIAREEGVHHPQLDTQSFWGKHRVKILTGLAVVGVIGVVALAILMWPVTFGVSATWVAAHGLLAGWALSTKVIVLACPVVGGVGVAMVDRCLVRSPVAEVRRPVAEVYLRVEQAEEKKSERQLEAVVPSPISAHLTQQKTRLYRILRNDAYGLTATLKPRAELRVNQLCGYLTKAPFSRLQLEENLAKILANPKTTVSLVFGCLHLGDNDSLDPRTFAALIASGPHATAVADGIVSLKENGLLNPDTLARITGKPNAMAIVDRLKNESREGGN